MEGLHRDDGGDGDGGGELGDGGERLGGGGDGGTRRWIALWRQQQTPQAKRRGVTVVVTVARRNQRLYQIYRCTLTAVKFVCCTQD